MAFMGYDMNMALICFCIIERVWIFSQTLELNWTLRLQRSALSIKTAKASKREWDIAQETHISNQQNLPLAPETLRENDKEETRVREAIREAINVNRKQENDREESETNCLTQKD